MKKISPNDPCPCHSGKKFKKCCRDKNLYDKYGKLIAPLITPPELIEMAKRFQSLPKEPLEKGGFLTGRPFVDAVHQGRRARAVGNTIYFRPLDETFHQFILHHFSEALGEKWILDQRIKPLNERHLIAQWFDELIKEVKDNSNPSLPIGQIRPIKQTGNMRALLALAYDYYSLSHCGAEIFPKLLNRLKNPDQFQGARYEMAVGAIAVRAGFRINWINIQEKHCEFIGIHNITGDNAAFEAKSHHRTGALSILNIPFDNQSIKIKIIDHIKEAADQAPQIPLIIFDDLNLPINSDQEIGEKSWFKIIQDELEINYYKPNKSTPFAALIITNFSWHFHKELIDISKKNEFVTYWHTGGTNYLDPQTIGFINEASKQYGFVPAKLDEER